ncbi:DNA-binding XRE family transcriptional regulator [Arcicella aurantiaca]|uniref:DNA-binding XRE family transcriptional regulator n=1 Tax=Arcicella aurantiaca TaxID=591202 RepID=A0A316DPL8_9BACT|nr:helix-turn-helix transcriptional regulator [Arcicella aurantiaca]PWK19448.1 DNA-binding XRE family transcriptional regulator [Arcicella aurantiaca]
MNKNNKIDSINARIKQLRLNNNLTQQEFADKINSTRAMIGQIETMVANPTLNMIINIVSNFEITYDFLIDGKERLEENSLNHSLQNQEIEFLKKEVELKNEIIEYQKQLLTSKTNKPIDEKPLQNN